MRAYARLRGWSVSTISRQVKAGIIPLTNGKIDPATADLAWPAKCDYMRLPANRSLPVPVLESSPADDGFAPASAVLGILLRHGPRFFAERLGMAGLAARDVATATVQFVELMQCIASAAYLRDGDCLSPGELPPAGAPDIAEYATALAWFQSQSSDDDPFGPLMDREMAVAETAMRMLPADKISMEAKR